MILSPPVQVHKAQRMGVSGLEENPRQQWSTPLRDATLAMFLMAQRTILCGKTQTFKIVSQKNSEELGPERKEISGQFILLVLSFYVCTRMI